MYRGKAWGGAKAQDGVEGSVGCVGEEGARMCGGGGKQLPGVQMLDR